MVKLDDKPDDIDFVFVKDLAAELGIDKSFFLKYVKRCGIDIHKRRDYTSGNQLTNAITISECEYVKKRRQEEGFINSSKVQQGNVGLFYIIQLIPELDSCRIKLGYTDDMNSRLQQHRTAAPTAVVLKTWPCKRSWESSIMDCLSVAHCKHILNEVFECEDINLLINRGDEVFNIFPSPEVRVEISKHSPQVESTTPQTLN